ncbi:hypothetical protein [Paenibacillus macerans]|uniref:hypothetical protein n=1 Tax=Paenibacillus macerans TaxID=44252 RepID=UPI003D318EB8
MGMEKLIGLFIGDFLVGEYKPTEYLQALDEAKSSFEGTGAIHEIKVISKNETKSTAL